MELGERRWAFAFDFSFINQAEELEMAELRLTSPGLTSPLLALLSQEAPKPLLVEIFHQPKRDGESGPDSCRERRLLGRSILAPSHVSVTPNGTVLEVTGPLSDWFGQSGPREGTPARGKETARDCEPRRPAGPASDVLLMLHSNPSKEQSGLGGSPLLRAAETSQRARGARLLRDKFKRHRRHEKEEAVSGASGRCRRVNFHVDFSQVGWSKWVIYPKQYNAYRCEGICPNPLGEEFKPTNHAYIQSMLKYYHPNLVPNTCCTPVKTRPMSMLYLEGDQVLLGHHEDMIVEECGCQ
ncbi:nodal homolog [Tachyglossus aculeatus]|uniref:nodal homolog n=1 Tax=Tachyglossus aculeatus TaxID=9261 RepID=UPI0018F4761A|nr:nodal homolog [Tachyglossus aculeatus]